MVSLVSGVTAAAVYLVFTTVAFFKYPAGYSPLTNWLSDLGNPLVNQSGAIFYNLGCILTSFSLIAFYIGLRAWNKRDKKLNIIMKIAQISGIFSSVFLIITALFPLGSHTPIHVFSGKMHVIFLGFFLTFSATALLKHPASIKWFAYFGFFSALVNFIYGAFLYSAFAAEWIAIGMFIIYVLMISYNSRLLINKEIIEARNERAAQ
jgi:hypothetical protein